MKKQTVLFVHNPQNRREEMCKECNDTKVIHVNRGAHTTEIKCPVCQKQEVKVSGLEKAVEIDTEGKCEFCKNTTWLTKDGHIVETWCEHCVRNHVRED